MAKENWPFEDKKNTAVFTTYHVLENKPILRVTHDVDDNSWEFHSEESPQIQDVKIVALEEIVEMDPTILELADLPVGWEAKRKSLKHPWARFNNR